MLCRSIIISALLIIFSACSSSEEADPIEGRWEWQSGSRTISPSGFERLHRDRNESYLVGDADFTFSFQEDGSFSSTYTLPGKQASLHAGTWSFSGDNLSLVYIEPADFTGITDYRIPNVDASALDLQWSVTYDEFTDQQLEEWTQNGSLSDEGWTVDLDSLQANFATPITSTITLHFSKMK